MLINRSAIDSFSISKRIMDPVTTFSASIKSDNELLNLRTGMPVQFYLDDLFGSTSKIKFSGRIDKITRDISSDDRGFQIEGRNNGLFLLEQPINFPCKFEAGEKEEILAWSLFFRRTLRSTGVMKDPGTLFIQQFTNDVSKPNHLCGEFRNKADAINYFLIRYGELNNLPKQWFRWYIDSEGYLNVFSVHRKDRPTIEFELSNQQILDLSVSEVSDHIKNEVTVLGGEENDIRVQVRNNASIERFGYRVNDPIADSNLTTRAEVNKKARDELKVLSEEIIVGSMTLVGFPPAECGIALKLHGDRRYNNKNFIITGVTHNGSPGDYTTSIEFSTDEHIVLNPNLTDIVGEMLRRQRENDCPSIGRVTSVNKENKTVKVKPIGNISKSVTIRQNIVLSSRSSSQSISANYLR